MYHNYSQIRDRVFTRQEFRGSSATGRYYVPADAPVPVGLDKEERDAYNTARAEAARAGYNIYVVKSYNTPVAWFYRAGDDYRTDGRVHVVGQKFSRTTSRLQALVAGSWRALHVERV